MWVFFHKLGSPRWFYTIAARYEAWCWALALIMILVGSVWGLVFAPEDYQQGNSFRIIYVHVPAAFLGQSIYIAMAVCGFVYMVWRVKLADMTAAMIAPLGAVMTFMALLSGSVWGKPTWGTWWQWDARLTSMLILLFLYIGVMVLRASFYRPESGARAAAILTMVGVVNIPIIKYSVEWWNTLHQSASFSITEAPAMPVAMWLPLLIMVVGFHAFLAAFTLTRVRSEILRREQRKRWVQDMFKEKC